MTPSPRIVELPKKKPFAAGIRIKPAQAPVLLGLSKRDVDEAVYQMAIAKAVLSVGVD